MVSWLEDANLIKRLLGIVLGLLVVGGAMAGVECSYSQVFAADVLSPCHVQVPALAFDDTSVTLVWDKPEQYADIVNYKVYMDGGFIGYANDAALSLARQSINAFYSDSANAEAQKISIHHYTVTGLQPYSKHTFTVASVDREGRESQPSQEVVQVTAAKSEVFNIADFGAVGDGVTVNTAAIQAAIDACTPGGKVLVPTGVFKTGSIWLKSDMTLEVGAGATLLGSENSEDYAFHELLYPYSASERFYSLINACTYEYGSLKNIRIVGEGIIDGNGWEKTGIDKDDPTQRIYPHANNIMNGDVLDKKHVLNIGILAKTSVEKAMTMGMDFKSAYNTRPSLITFRGVDTAYFGGFTAVNPANHTVVLIKCNHAAVNNVVLKTYDCNNADGIEFISSNGLQVFDTFFDTGDDSMNMAAGLGAAGQKEASTKNIWIFDNYFRHGHGAVVPGSHTAAWIENVLAEDNVIFHSEAGLRCKSNWQIGGGVRNVVFRDNALKDIKRQAFIFTSDYADPSAVLNYEAAAAPPKFYNIEVRNNTVDGTGAAAIEVAGVQKGEHENITFENVRFFCAKPAVLRYMKNSSFRNVSFEGTIGEPWKITSCSGIQFEATTMNNSAIDAMVGPSWPKESSLKVNYQDAGVELSWTPAQDNVGVASYNIMNGNTLIAVVPGKTLTYKVTDVLPGLTYNFKIEAADRTGNVTTNGPECKLVTKGKASHNPPVLPLSEKDVQIEHVGPTWLTVKWQPTAATSRINHYVVYANNNQLAIVNGDVYNYLVGGLSGATRYCFAIKAVDVYGNSSWYSAKPLVTTPPGYDAGVPRWKANSYIRVKEISGNKVTLCWTAATDDRGVTGYRVYQDGKAINLGGEPFTPVNPLYTVPVNKITIDGLTPNTRYVFKVDATDALGHWSASGPSIEVITPK
ncbi:MAG: Exo-poly-alpha-galacturonosidase [Firmicutes bacterium]|nr:Exo-poly-alpha-galacturonosidase [Bacillota bacterium]